MKEIYCFGTSQTAGGGFEFDSNDNSRGIVRSEPYENFGEELTQFNFSYPGRLQSISNEYKVFNIAKSGHGNDRTIRKAYDIIKSKTDEELKNLIFVIEYAYTGRKEVFLNNLNKYAICNYSFTDKLNNKVRLDGVAIDYFYDDDDTNRLLRMNRDSIQKYFSKTINIDEEEKKLEREFSIFLSFLENLNIKFILLSGWPDFRNHVFKKYSIDFEKLTPYKSSPLGTHCLEETIHYETNGKIHDYHNNFTINNWIAKVIYNYMIDNNILDSGDRIEDTYPYETITTDINYLH